MAQMAHFALGEPDLDLLANVLGPIPCAEGNLPFMPDPSILVAYSLFRDV